MTHFEGCTPSFFALATLSWWAVVCAVGAEASVGRAACSGAGREACSAVELERVQHDHVLLQMKPALLVEVGPSPGDGAHLALLDSGVGHDVAAAVNASRPSLSSLPGRGAACVASAVSRRRGRTRTACTCRRRSSGAKEDVGTGLRCEGVWMVAAKPAWHSPPVAATPAWHAPPGYRPDAGTGSQRPGPPSAWYRPSASTGSQRPGPPRAWRAPQKAKQASPVGDHRSEEGRCSACLCVFDIDRTLTGKQSDVRHCPRNRELPLYDDGYGGGNATLSALAAAGLSTTFCNECHLSITSAGHGSGEHSSWNRYLLEHVMRGETHDAFTAAHPESQKWSHGSDVRSPYVLGQSNKVKQNAVELIRRWFGAPGRGVCISPQNVFFFGDRTENIQPFRSKHFNSREISCGSRDASHHRGIGYCGATPEEIKRETGNVLCPSSRL